ncbi:MAG: FapA family protein [Lachnospiraceae bacterium]|nr:FapA family protein [Lachnospiraceae bacterium]
MQAKYSEDQLKEIELGKSKGLDTSIYENPAFLAMHMHEIRIGLEKGIDAKKYASTDYDWQQMRELRRGLENCVDISKFADKNIPHDVMREERKALEARVDISDYKGGRRGRSSAIMRQLRKGRQNDVDLIKYIEEGYDAEQLESIRTALEKEVDIEPYLNIDFRGSAIDEIRVGLEDGVDVSLYAGVEYNWKQMREIRLGIIHRVDISKYSNSLYSSLQMKEIRLGLQAGLNVDEYSMMRFSASDMRKKRQELLELVESATKTGEQVLAELDNLIKKEQDREAGLDPMTLMVSTDKMEAYAVIREGYDDITEQEVLKMAWDSGIRKGIKRDAMKEIENGFRGEEGKVLIAKGELPESGKDGWYEYFFRTDLDGKPKILEDGSVDYNNIEWFDICNKGQTVAIYHPATKAKDGFNVYGETTPGRNGIEQPMLSGKGFTVTKDKLSYISNENGMIVLRDGKRLEISSVLEVEEVTNATGFIVYKGSVHVRGDVGSGGVINCGGDVIVDGFVEGGNITADGDVLLKRGMNGGGRGVIRAGKNVTGKFFENADVYAGDTITIDYATNSMLFAENMLEVKKTKGAIIGGRATGLRGMTVQNVGNKMGQKTILAAGVPKSMDEKRKEIRERISLNKEQLKVLRNAELDFHNKYPMNILSQMDIFTKIENAIYTKELDIEQANKDLEEFLETMKEYSKSKIVVKGDLYDGVDVEISGKHWISYGMSRVTLKLVNDENGEHIIAYNE